MTDEIDLLRRFRADVPQASPQAWEKSRAAVAAQARRENLRRPRRALWVRRSGLRAFVPVAASVAAVVLLVTGVLVLHGLGGGTHAGARTTKPAAPRDAGRWGLSGYLTTGADGPLPTWMTCPTVSVCYVVGDPNASPPHVLYVSDDGARDWKSITEPVSMRFTSRLSCWSADSCAAGATSHGTPAIAYTADGGRTWRFTRLPGGVGTLFSLECSGAASCHGLASATTPSVYGLSTNATFVTVAGGQISSVGFPANPQMQDLACPSGDRCIAVGVTTVSGPGVVEVSYDGGLSWRQASVPQDFRWQATDETITCPSVSDCWASGLSAAGSAIISSTDGGLTWHYSYNPATRQDRPQINGIACPSVGSCQAWGGWPHGTGPTWAAAVLSSRDGGASWTARTFDVPKSVPSGVTLSTYGFIYSVQCPDTAFCVGLGGPASGSSATAIYALRG